MDYLHWNCRFKPGKTNIKINKHIYHYYVLTLAEQLPMRERHAKLSQTKIFRHFNQYSISLPRSFFLGVLSIGSQFSEHTRRRQFPLKFQRCENKWKRKIKNTENPWNFLLDVTRGYKYGNIRIVKRLMRKREASTSFYSFSFLYTRVYIALLFIMPHIMHDRATW